MKKYFTTVIIVFFCSACFVGCAVYSTVTTNKWLEYELPPSKIVKNGRFFLKENYLTVHRFLFLLMKKLMMMQDFIMLYYGKILGGN